MQHLSRILRYIPKVHTLMQVLRYLPNSRGAWLFLLFTLPLLLPAQSQTVYLHNGWILHGDTAQIDGKLHISTCEANEFWFTWAEVDSIRPAKKRNLLSPDKKRGFSALYQLGFLMNNPDPESTNADDSRGTYYTLSLQATHGYKFFPALTLGLGTGINLYGRGAMMPVYADLRGDLATKGVVRPHYYIQAGTNIPLYSRDEVAAWWGGSFFRDFKAKGKLFLDIGLGAKIRTASSFDYVISLGYRLQQIEESYESLNVRYLDQYSFKRVSFQIGFLF